VDDHADTWAGATSIRTNSTTSGTIEVAGDADTLQVSMAAGHQYTLTTTLGTLSNATAKLYAADGSTLLATTALRGTAGATTNLYYYCTATNTYYLQLAGAAGATGTYALIVQPARLDLGLTNLVIAPGYLKQRVAPTAIRFGITLSAASAPVSGYAATLDVFRGTNIVLTTNSITLTLTNQPGSMLTVNLTEAQVQSLDLQATNGGTFQISARLRPPLDDTNPGNNQATATVLVDDYPDTLPDATTITTNRTTTGTIEVAGDVDTMKVALAAERQYAFTITLGTLSNATAKLYAPDRLTLLTSRTLAGAPGTMTNAPHYCSASGTYYLQLAGAGGATGTYFVLMQPQSLDLGLTNLVIAPNYLKQRATPAAIRFGVTLPADSAPVSGYAATVAFYQTTNSTSATNNPIGSISVTLTSQPGNMITVNLSPGQLSSLRINSTTGGAYRILAHLQPPQDDPNTSNNWSAATVLVDDYPDTLPDATAITTNRAAAGIIEAAGDVDAMKVTLVAGHQYAVTTTLGSLAGAVTTLYGEDRQTVLGTSTATAGTPATISYLSPRAATCYIHVDGSGAATGSYTVAVQPQATDLYLTNLVFQPYYLKKGATPTNVTFDVGLTAASATITARQATVSFHLSTDSTLHQADRLLGSSAITLTILPGATTSLQLSPSQLAALPIPTNAAGAYTVIATLETFLDDAHTNSNQSGTTVWVDDHADTLAAATAIGANTNIPGLIEDAADLDTFKIPLADGHIYVITLASALDRNALTSGVLRLYQQGVESDTLLDISTCDTNGLIARIVFTNAATANYHLQVSDMDGQTGTYLLQVRELTQVSTNAVADVAVCGVTLALAPGDVRGQHPAALAYELRNNSLTTSINNAYYLLEFYLAPTNNTAATNEWRHIGHCETQLTLDHQQTRVFPVPAEQLPWTTIPADLSNGTYYIAMHITPVREPVPLAPDDPIDTNNWVTGNSLVSPGREPVISGKVTLFDSSIGISNVVLTITDYPGTGVVQIVTDEQGCYRREVTNNWSGHVVASYTNNGLTGGFSPTNRTYTRVTNDWTAQNFSWTPPPMITGTIRDFQTGAALAGIPVAFQGVSIISTSDANGTFSLAVPYGWSGKVTPSDTNGGFWPAARAYTNVTTRCDDANFTWLPPPVISGTILDFYTGLGVASVTVTVTVAGTPYNMDVTDEYGDYRIEVTNGWSGTLTTSFPDSGFLPAHLEYEAVLMDELSQDFFLIPPPVISGSIRHALTGAGLAGVTIQFTNTASGSTTNVTTDLGGYYAFMVPFGASGTLSPLPTINGTFAPATRDYADIHFHQTSQDFQWTPTPEPPVISGTIRDFYTGSGVPGVTVTVTAAGVPVVTDSQGSYRMVASNGWTGIIEPQAPHSGFEPRTLSYAVGVTCDQPDQNFVLFPPPQLSGTIRDFATGSGVADFTLTFTDDAGTRTTTTDANGSYTLPVPYGWRGTVVTPANPSGGFITPHSLSYEQVTTNLTAQDYTWLAPVTIAGTVTRISGISGGVANVLLQVSQPFGPVTNQTTGLDGSYALIVPLGWTGTLTPQLVGYTFLPASRTYAALTEGQTAQNYTCRPSPLLSGKITRSGTKLGVTNVLLTVTGVGTTKTDSNGSYAIFVPYDWSGTITPALTDSGRFSPTIRSYRHVTTSKTLQNYTWYPANERAIHVSPAMEYNIRLEPMGLSR
jgi:hypothetical protein